MEHIIVEPVRIHTKERDDIAIREGTYNGASQYKRERESWKFEYRRKMNETWE